ncbi:protein FAM53A-like isoform X2 [Acanthaster planci]|uniref:Protein FAM53A-like isoform X2 n=1 Tax=Acanthaster planci TaxID=133434 RepID=A0A8B7XJ44_ACAPL|nr:protein FAM53A-like isoform X2 [Acanthaster planci]
MFSSNCCLPGGPAKPGSGLVDILVASRINFNMVTVITEKLQNQSLDDVKFAEIIPYQTRSKTKARVWQKQNFQHVALSVTGNKGTPQVISQEKLTPERPNRSHPTTPQSAAPSKTLESESNITDVSAITPAPPKKRHCRSLSAGEVNERKWRPRSSKIWRAPVQSRRKCDTHQTQLHSSHQKAGSGGLAGIPGSSGLNPSVNEFSTPPESPIPRPTSSASWDGTNSGIPYWLEHATFRPVLSPRAYSRSFSEDKASESSGSVCSFTGSTDSELDRGVVPQRCHSHPSVRKSGKKRRREEETRPKLDLFKMEEAPFVTPEDWPYKSRGSGAAEGKNSLESSSSSQRHRRLGNQTLMNKYYTRSYGKSLLDSQQFCGLQTIASSPRDTSGHASSILITPTSSPTQELDQQPAGAGLKPAPGPQYSLRNSTRCHDAERECQECCHSSDEENGDELDREDGFDSGIFPLDPSNELDVDQIEQN